MPNILGKAKLKTPLYAEFLVYQTVN